MQYLQTRRRNKAPSSALTTSFASSGPQLPSAKRLRAKAKRSKAVPSAPFSRLTPAAFGQCQVSLWVPAGPLPVPASRSGVRASGCGRRWASGRAEPQRRGAQRGPRLLPCPGPGGDPGLPGAPGFGSTAAVLRAQLALCSLGCHPTPRPGAQKAEVFGREKHGFFSARLRTPFRENAPVKFYFPCKPPSTLPRIKTGRD